MSANIEAQSDGTTHQMCPFGGNSKILHINRDGRSRFYCVLATGIQARTISLRERNLREAGCPKWQLTRHPVMQPVPLPADQLDCVYVDGEMHEK